MNVPKLRFKEFDGEWEACKLGSVTNSFSGGTPSVGNSSYYNGDVPFIRSGEINSEKTELFLTEEGLNNSSAKIVEVGDILYALYGATSGEVSISKIHGAINQAILAIKPIKGYSSQFIMQWLKLQKKKVIGKYLQGGQGNLSGSIVKDLLVKFPNFEEQQKNGEFFEKLDKKIQLQQQKINLLQEQKKGYMQKIFNIDLNRELNSNLNFEWKETIVGNIVSSFSGGTPSITNKNYYNGEIPFIRSGELHSHTTELFLSEEGLEKSSAKLVQEGDLLYALYGATSGEVEISKIAGAINQAILCLRLKEDNKYFLRYWLEYKKDYILKTYLQGGQGNLSASIIKSLNIYLPSHERQENIAIFFLQLDERINFEKEKKILLQKQKQGFMQQMFI